MMADERFTSEKDTGSAVTGKNQTTTERSRTRRPMRPDGTTGAESKPSWRTGWGLIALSWRAQRFSAVISSTSRTLSIAVEAARKYAADLASYDYRKLDDNFTTVTDNSTGQFAEQYEHVSSALTELIEQQQAVSDGSVLSAGIAELDENRAVVLLFVDQKITNVNSPEPRIDRTRMQMTLSRENNHWLIADIKLL